jgi:hypothetical protein
MDVQAYERTRRDPIIDSLQEWAAEGKRIDRREDMVLWGFLALIIVVGLGALIMSGGIPS